MLRSVADQIPSVPINPFGYDNLEVPAEDIDTHRMLSATALKIARIEEPIYFQEWYDENNGQYWGYLNVIYHYDAVIKWAEIEKALRYDYLTGGLMWFPEKRHWDGNLRLDTQCMRINFTPTARR